MMGAMSKLKSAARHLLVTRPTINFAGRAVWRFLTVGRPETRKKYPIIGSFPVRLPDRSTIVLYTAVEDWLLTGLYWHGFDEGESQELSVFLILSRGAGTVLDIGANIGVYSVAVARSNPRTAVHAFEPLPSNLKTLKKLAQLNGCGNLTAHEVALSDRAGEATFYIPRNRKCNVRDGSLVAGFRDDVDEINVKLETLDAFAARQQLGAIDVMKIDVETAEEYVLRGAAGVLAKDRPVIICEVLRGGEKSAVARIMRSHNYRFFWIGPSGLLENGHLDADPREKYRMYLMLPMEKADAALSKLRGAGVKISTQEPSRPGN